MPNPFQSSNALKSYKKIFDPSSATHYVILLKLLKYSESLMTHLWNGNTKNSCKDLKR